MYWYLKVLKNYAGFSGRAQRAEYWMFILFNVLIGLTCVFFAGFFADNIIGIGVTGLHLLYSFAILIPGFAVAIRRLHDTGKSGWWILISFIPLVGTIVLIYFLAVDSSPETNDYGPNPKTEADDTASTFG